jgi:hypothetical protein
MGNLLLVYTDSLKMDFSDSLRHLSIAFALREILTHIRGEKK